MGLRPFPYKLGIGTDIVHVTRIRAILQKDRSKPGYLDRFLRRFLTPRERIDFYKTQDSFSGVQLDASSKHLAGRYVVCLAKRRMNSLPTGHPLAALLLSTFAEIESDGQRKKL